MTTSDIHPEDSARLASLPSDRVSFVRIGPDADGQRLDNFLVRVAKGVPKSHIYRIIRSGEVRVNKARAKAETRLAEGDLLRLPPVRVSERAVTKAPPAALAEGTVPVLFEDRHLLIVNKPAGLAAHGGSGISHGLIERMRASRPDVPFLELAHRLDRETSGAIILCKTRKALVRFHEMMKTRAVEKHYTLLVKGDWPDDRRHVDEKEGMPSHTIFTKLKRYGAVTLLDAELLTGRTHQIRVHSLSVGFPLVGDDKYGDFEFNRLVAQGALGVPLKRMFLHSRTLAFEHPVTGEAVRVEAPLWPDCEALLAALDKKGQK